MSWYPILGSAAVIVVLLVEVMPTMQRSYAIGVGALVVAVGVVAPDVPWVQRVASALLACGVVYVAVWYHRVGRYRVRASGWFGRGDGGEDRQPGR